MLRSTPLLVCTLVAAGAFVPATARAADPPAALDSRGYVYGAPGIVSIPLGDDDYEDLVEVGYRWGLGVGGVFAFGRHVGGSIGFAFDHAPLNLDENVDDFCGLLGECSVRAHKFRFAPELRIGGGLGPFFAYGTAAPGLGLFYQRVEGTALGSDFDEDDTDLAFGLGVGGGVMFTILEGLTFGFEIGGDLNFVAEGDDEDIDFNDPDGGYGAHALDLKAYVGYWF